jgi:hypothetical protein
MQQGLIYDPTAFNRIDDFLSSQEKELQKIDSESENQNKKVIRIAILVGVSAILILGLKIITKRKK